ncbi:hsp70 nucleotide exchange factor fes1 [Teleopsis dalmanni]|uniref:hsp70 nucleotide exchange factor fes1 n=1 Tax=Teleopsis dalmanni TaxID=139649 RepID=UPI0018CD3FAA|nr:hsp70 nucleotide exchange factor fes1 [Teleopsis dalmanni]
MDKVPREKQDSSLEGVLRFAISQSDGNATDAPVEEMDNERKEFLNNVLKSMSSNVSDELKNSVKVLSEPSANNSEKLDALAFIRDNADNIDFANAFAKTGGTKVLIECIEAEDTEISSNAIYIVGEMAQNNPFCQQHFIDARVVPLLTSQLDREEVVTCAALYALSAICRSYKPGCMEFIKNNGVEVLLISLRSPNSKIFIKSAFLISVLSSEYPNFRDQLAKTNAMELLVNNIENLVGFDMKLDAVLRALSQLTGSTKWNLSSSTQLKLEQSLKTIIERDNNLDACKEMVEYAEKILKNIKSHVL